LQEAAPTARPECREQAEERGADAGSGAQIQDAQERDRRRRQILVAQPEPHRRAGRAALRHQSSADRPGNPVAAPVGKLWRVARGFSQELSRIGTRSEMAVARVETWRAR